MYNTTDVINKTFQDKKKKDDLMKKVREQTALLKKKKQEKEFEDKIHKGLNDSADAYEREISKLEKQISTVKNIGNSEVLIWCHGVGLLAVAQALRGNNYTMFSGFSIATLCINCAINQRCHPGGGKRGTRSLC